MNFAILDDEKHCVESLVIHLNTLYPDSAIVYRGNRPEEALSELGQLNIDILFLDVEMPGLTGFQFLEQLTDRKFDVIFTTAYSRYAIDAFRAKAINYLMKPIDEDELKEAVENWQKSGEKDKNNNKQLDELLDSLRKDNVLHSKISVPVSDGFEFLKVSSIIYCQSKSNYTDIFLENDKKILVSKTLKEIESKLEGFSFLRIHQSYLINPDYLTKFVRRDGGYVILQDNIHVPVGPNKRKLITDFFDEIDTK